MAKIKDYLLLAATVVYLISFYSCLNTITGEGETTLATRNLDKFTKIELSINADVYLTDSLEQSCTISAQQNLMNIIETIVKDDKLIISSKKDIIQSKPITIYLSATRLSDIELNGSGKIIGTNTIKSSKVSIDLSGSGAVILDLVSDVLKASVSGSGELRLKGNTNVADFEISGSGVIEAFGLGTGNCNIDISGSGKAFVLPSGELKADISGSGNVRYKGNPSKINSSISGSGNIEKSE